jgi:hypothetical protein
MNAWSSFTSGSEALRPELAVGYFADTRVVSGCTLFLVADMEKFN